MWQHFREAGHFITRLYKYDGSEVTKISNIHSDGADTPNRLTVFNGALYFSAYNDSHFTKLYRYRPTDSNIVQVSDIHSDGNDTPDRLTVFNDALYFSAVSGHTEGDMPSYSYKLYKFE